MASKNSFTVVDFGALVLISCLFVICFSAAAPVQVRFDTLRQENNTKVRGIMQSMFQYSANNNNRYPGLRSTTDLVDASTEFRLQVLLEKNYFKGDLLVSPIENLKPWSKGKLNRRQYSYALLQIDDAKADLGRRKEWGSTANSYAPVVSDRNTGVIGQFESVWSALTGEHRWIGSVVYNDGHVVFEKDPTLVKTNFAAVKNRDDNLFGAAGPDDACMTFSRGDVSMPMRGPKVEDVP